MNKTSNNFATRFRSAQALNRRMNERRSAGMTFEQAQRFEDRMQALRQRFKQNRTFNGLPKVDGTTPRNHDCQPRTDARPSNLPMY